MVGRDGLKLLSFGMVERHFRPAGDAELFDFGEEIGDDVVGVGGVEEAGGGEIGCQEVEQRPEVLRASMDGGELH